MPKGKVDFLTSLENEHKALKGRMNKLQEYTRMVQRFGIPDLPELPLLEQQLTAMQSYANVLSSRIALSISNKQAVTTTPEAA